MLRVLHLYAHEWRDLEFKVYSERQIFEELFMAILLTRRAICVFFLIRFVGDV